MEVKIVKFKLDFGIYSAEDRMKEIKKIDLEHLTKLELETVTNYVLYGKDEDGTSSVDRKEIQIKTKFNSYNRNKTVSLDEMMESPTFDESTLAKNKTIYKKVKPTIDKEKAAKIPDMIALWETIEKQEKLLAELKEIKNPSPEEKKQIYYLNHHLIQLRTEQYYIMDSHFPTIQLQRNRAQFHESIVDSQMSYPVLPRGVMREQNDIDFRTPRLNKDSYSDTMIYSDDEVDEMIRNKKPFFDFRNTKHLYQLIQHYAELQDYVRLIPDSPIHNLLWTLDFYIEKANLSEQQLLIVRDKKMRQPNKVITANLMEELGIYHQENYVSTIWNKIVRLIADAAELNYDEFLCRNYDKAWKICSRCGEEYLRDPRNFVRKAKAADGLTGRCKKCDREIRQMNKGG